MEPREEETIIKICEQEPDTVLEGLSSILTEHGPPLLDQIRRLLRVHGITYNLDDMAEEIFQQVAMELLVRGRDGKLMEVESIPGYVYRAAKFRTLRYLRDEGRRSDLTPLAGSMWDNTEELLEASGLSPAEAAELGNALAACIGELEGLKKEYVEIMAAHWSDPPSPSEIARWRGVSSGSVRNRLHEARVDLEDCLRGKGYTISLRRKGGHQ